MTGVIPILYLAPGAVISFFGVLGFIEPDKLLAFRASLIVKRLLAVIAVLIGGTLMSQGFAHF